MILLAVVAPPRFRQETRWSVRLPSSRSFFPQLDLTVADGRAFYRQGGPPQVAFYGALDLQTGRPLWRVAADARGVLRLVAGGGHLVATSRDEAWQVDPRDGRTVWTRTRAHDGLGPFVAGDRLVLETTPGRLTAIDPRSRRTLWTLDRFDALAGLGLDAVACVARDELWVAGDGGEVLAVGLADGRVRIDRQFDGGEIRNLVPMGGAVLVEGVDAREAWDAASGRVRWRSRHPALYRPVYVARRGELWTAFPPNGPLYRFRVSDGARVGPPVELGNEPGPTENVFDLGEGYAALSSRDAVRLGEPEGAQGARFWSFRPWDVVAGTTDSVTAWEDYISRVTLRAVAPPRDPLAALRRLAAKAAWSYDDTDLLGRLGRVAVPTILAGRARMDRESYGQGDGALLRAADARDTRAVLPVIEENIDLGREPFGEESAESLWLRTKAEPDRIAAWLLPRLRTERDPATQARYAQWMARSARPEIVSELRARLLAPWSDVRVKRAVYTSLAASGSPLATGTILGLRRGGPFPRWPGAVLLEATTETERVLAAAFDGRMRFEESTVSSFALDYGPGVRPFAVTGWAGILSIGRPPVGQRFRTTARVPSPYVAFLPLDLDGTMVRFSSGGTEAAARIAVSTSPEETTEDDVRLRKVRGEWFVTGMWEERSPYLRR